MFRSICFAFLLAAICNGETEETVENIKPRDPQCSSRNGYHPIEANCDAYIECRDFQAVKMLCPDGLHFDPQVRFPNYPCGYPIEVSCQGRGSPQPAIGTSECPHQYGFFPSPRASMENCEFYLMCVKGNAMQMSCPVGLAFNVEAARCDWPDLVSTCDADAFLGFKCPPVQLDDAGRPITTAVNYKYEGNCYAFFSCEMGHARLLTCDAGFMFDPTTGRCEDADRVKCGTEITTTAL